MEILIGIIGGVVVLDTFLLICLAITVSRLIKYKEISENKLVDLPVAPTYDVAVFKGKVEPYSDGVEQRFIPLNNWDGVRQQ